MKIKIWKIKKINYEWQIKKIIKLLIIKNMNKKIKKE